MDYIKRDSLFLLQYDIRMMPTMFGTLTPDTFAIYKIQYSLKNVYSFPATPRKFGLVTNGTLFMVGGAGYLLLNIVNTIHEKDAPFGKDNLPNIIGGVAAFGVGLLLNKTKPTEFRLGKKYQLKYLPVEAVPVK